MIDSEAMCMLQQLFQNEYPRAKVAVHDYDLILQSQHPHHALQLEDYLDTIILLQKSAPDRSAALEIQCKMQLFTLRLRKGCAVECLARIRSKVDPFSKYPLVKKVFSKKTSLGLNKKTDEIEALIKNGDRLKNQICKFDESYGYFFKAFEIGIELELSTQSPLPSKGTVFLSLSMLLLGNLLAHYKFIIFQIVYSWNWWLSQF